MLSVRSEFARAAALITLSLGYLPAIAQHQASPPSPPPTPTVLTQGIKPVTETTQPLGTTQPENAASRVTLRAIRKEHGDATLYDVLTKPAFKLLRAEIVKRDVYLRDLDMAKSGTVARALRTARIKDLIDADGNYTSNPLTNNVTKELAVTIAALRAEGADLGQAIRADSTVNAELNFLTQQATLVTFDTRPILLATEQSIKLDAIFDQKGEAREYAGVVAALKGALTDGLRAVTLRDLADPKNNDILAAVTSAAINQTVDEKPEALNRLAFRFAEPLGSITWRAFAAMPSITLGEMMKEKPAKESPAKENGTEIRFDATRVAAVLDKVDAHRDAYLKEFSHAEAARGVTAYDYICHPKDPSGIVPLMVAVGNEDFIDLIQNKKNGIPEKALESLKKLPLREALLPSGQVNVAVVRDAMFKGIADEKVALLDWPFLIMAGAGEVETLIVKSLHHPEAQAQTDNITYRDLIADGSETKFNAIMQKYGSKYPADGTGERILDVIGYQGLNGSRNPWRVSEIPHFAVPSLAAQLLPGKDFPSLIATVKKPARMFAVLPTFLGAREKPIPSDCADFTTVPYSFDLQANPITLTAGQTDLKPLSPTEQSMFNYVADEMSRGICAKLEKTPFAIPFAADDKGIISPRGMPVFNADLSEAPVNGNADELGAVGETYRPDEYYGNRQVYLAVTDELSAEALKLPTGDPMPPAQKRENNIATLNLVYFHEIQHGFYGANHVFDNAMLAGTTDDKYDHNFKYKGPDGTAVLVTTDRTAMSYAIGDFSWLTRTELDIKNGRIAYGFHRENDSDPSHRRITAEIGQLETILTSPFKPSTIKIGTDRKFAQAIFVPPEQTGMPQTEFDFRTIDGLPAVLRRTPLDLSQSTNDLRFSVGGKELAMTRVVLIDDLIRKATLGFGSIIGTPGDDIIQVEIGGTLAGGGGNDRLVGGTSQPTLFIGGPGKKTFVIRAGSRNADINDEIDAYKKDDVIVVPAGTRLMVYEAQARDQASLQASFYNASGRPIKSVMISASGNTAIDPKAMKLYNPDGVPVQRFAAKDLLQNESLDPSDALRPVLKTMPSKVGATINLFNALPQ